MFRFNLAVVAFALVFLLLAGKSEAAMSYAGKCYPDSATALEGFVQSFPFFTNGANGFTAHELLTSPTIVGNVISYSVHESYPSLGVGAGITDPTMFLTLPICPQISAPVVSNSTVMIVCAAVVLAMMGFAAGKGYR